MHFLAVEGFMTSPSIIIERIRDARQKNVNSTRADGSSASGGTLLRHILEDICWQRENACEKCLTAQPGITEPMGQLDLGSYFKVEDELMWCLHQLEFYAASLVLRSGGTMDKFHDMLESLVRSYIDDEKVVQVIEMENSYIQCRQRNRAQCAYTSDVKTEDKYDIKRFLPCRQNTRR
ncbi:hypothetical protein ACOMHN_014249 [Nucella lapillus]